jgi:hypothetical protein
MNKKLCEKGKIIKPCNDHIGGLLGEALLRFFLKEKLIERDNSDYFITEKGWDELEIIGIDVEKLRLDKRKIVKICIESNHGILYEHIGSYLGSLILQRMFELEWIIKQDEKRFELTNRGISGLESLGVKIKSLT